MTKLSGRITVICGVGLALVPLLLFMYLALYNRLLIDDYVYFGLARDIGTWNAMWVWREVWNGGYSNFLLYGLLAPLGPSAPSLFLLFLSTTAFIGYGWLSNILLASLGICAHRRAVSVVMASIATAATINSVYHQQAFYWMTGAVVYTLPAVLLLLGIGMAVEAARRLRGRLQLLLAAFATAIYAFMNGGFSEMYLVFQLTAMSLIALFVLVFHMGPKRISYVILVMAGLSGSVASLGVQLTSPGFQNRSSQPNYDGVPIFPIRDLPDLMERVLDVQLEYMGHEASFAGFMLVASVGLFFTLSLGKRYGPASEPANTAAIYASIAFALVVQLLFMPILWSHQSDNLQVLDRFSFAFMLIVCPNAIAIAVLLALLWRRDLLDKALKRQNGLMICCGCVLLLVCLLFMMTQVRSIHYKASSYLFVTALSMLIMLSGLLTFNANEPRLRGFFLLSAFATAGAVITLAALICVKLWGLGYIVERTLTSATFALMLAGLLNGLTLGVLIRRGFQMTEAKAVWLRCIKLFCILIALTIATGMMIGHGQRINHVREDAAIWDATHQEIMRMRDAGDPAVYTKRFPTLLHKHIGAIPSRYKNAPLDWEMKTYYGLWDDHPDISDCRRLGEENTMRTVSRYGAMVICLAYGKSI